MKRALLLLFSALGMISSTYAWCQVIETKSDVLFSNESMPSDVLAKLVRSRTDMSWLFEPVLYAHIVASPEDRKKALLLDDLAKVAVARGLKSRSDVSAALEATDTLVLAEAARRSLIDSVVVSDKDVAERIATHPGRYDTYHISHIFVAVGPTPRGTRSDAEALAAVKKLRSRLASGEAFAAVASAASEDAETSGQAGELSPLMGVTMNPIFFNVVKAMKVGQISDPVRGPEGYHLLRLDEREAAGVASARFWVEQDIIGEKLPALIEKAIADTSKGIPSADRKR